MLRILPIKPTLLYASSKERQSFCIPPGRTGFALAVALVLMSFLLLICLALGALVQVNLSTAGVNKELLQARANAITGLQQALGELQAAAGPDQRVTARADILSSDSGASAFPAGNKYWTGVWDNRILDGAKPRPDDLTKYGSNRNSSTGKLPGLGSTAANAPRWLISAPSGAKIDPAQRLIDVPEVADVATMTFPTTTSADDAVEAAIIHVNGNGNSGGFAWWIADEGIKANIALPYDRSDDWSAGTSNIFIQQLAANELKYTALGLIENDGSKPFDHFLPLNSMDAKKSDSIQDIFLAQESLPAFTQKILNRNYHDLTLHSASVLADVQNGGLKLDLSRALEEQWPDFITYMAEAQGRDVTSPSGGRLGTNAAPLFAVDFPTGVGKSSYGSNGTEDGDRIYGPPWDILYNYYHSYKPIQPYSQYLSIPTGESDIKNFSKWRFQGYVSTPETFTSGTAFGPNTDPGELTRNIYSYERDTNLASPGMRHPESINGRSTASDSSRNDIHTSAQGTAQNSGMMPQPVDYYRYEPDYQVGDIVRIRNEGNALISRGRGEPQWNSLSPIMVAAGFRLGLSTVPASTNGSIQSYSLRLHFQPYFVLWNPYNITLAKRPYRLTIGASIALQVYWDTDGGEPEPEDLLFKNYADGTPVPYDSWSEWRDTSSNRYYDLNPDTRGVFLHRLFSANSGQISNRRVSGLSFLSEDISLGPGEFIIVSPTEQADSTVGKQRYLSRTQTNYVGAYPTFSNKDISDDAGFYLNLKYVADWKDRVPDIGTPEHTIPTIDVDMSETDPVAINNRKLTVRFYNSPYGSEDPRTGESGYIGQSGASIGLHHTGDKIPWTTNITDLTFFKPDELYDTQDVVIGSPENLNDILLGWFHINMRSSLNSGDLPYYSVLNPRAMLSESFIGGESIVLETIFEKGPFVNTSRLPGVTESPSGHYLVYGAGGISGSQTDDRTSLVLYDLPRQPLRSVGDFMHANLSFFDTMPSYMIGSSYASPYIHTQTYGELIDNPTLGRPVLLPDVSYLANDALFDEFFFSTVPVDLDSLSAPYDAAYKKYSTADIEKFPPFEKVNESFILNGKSLPNKRMAFYFNQDEDAATYLKNLRNMKTAASHLMLNGAFNVNSTSVEAWMAFLGGIKALSSIEQDGGSAQELDYYNTQSENVQKLDNEDLGFAFLRFSSPAGEAGDKYRGFNSLTEDELRSLATQVVAEIKKRGPFLSMADFVNRRLVSGETGRKGALQAAIDNTSINSGMDDYHSMLPKDVVPSIDAALLPSVEAGLPGYLLQNDILRTLGPQLTVRSDTFVIRAYGEAQNEFNGKHSASAMCEAVVQRIPDWVDPEYDSSGQALEPSAPIYTHSAPGAAQDFTSALSEVNQNFGRKFRIVSFRWLSADEIPNQN